MFLFIKLVFVFKEILNYTAANFQIICRCIVVDVPWVFICLCLAKRSFLRGYILMRDYILMRGYMLIGLPGLGLLSGLGGAERGEVEIEEILGRREG